LLPYNNYQNFKIGKLAAVHRNRRYGVPHWRSVHLSSAADFVVFATLVLACCSRRGGFFNFSPMLQQDIASSLLAQEVKKSNFVINLRCSSSSSHCFVFSAMFSMKFLQFHAYPVFQIFEKVTKNTEYIFCDLFSS